MKNNEKDGTEEEEGMKPRNVNHNIHDDYDGLITTMMARNTVRKTGKSKGYLTSYMRLYSVYFNKTFKLEFCILMFFLTISVPFYFCIRRPRIGRIFPHHTNLQPKTRRRRRPERKRGEPRRMRWLRRSVRWIVWSQTKPSEKRISIFIRPLVVLFHFVSFIS